MAYGSPNAQVFKASVSAGVIIVGAGCLASLALAGIIRTVYQRARHDEQVEQIEHWAESFRSRSRSADDTAIQRAIEDAESFDDIEDVLDDDPTGELPRRALLREQMRRSAELENSTELAGSQTASRRPRHAAHLRAPEAEAPAEPVAVDSSTDEVAQPARRGRHARAAAQADAQVPSVEAEASRRAHRRHAAVSEVESVEVAPVAAEPVVAAPRPYDTLDVLKPVNEVELPLDSLQKPTPFNIDELLDIKPVARRRRARAHTAQEALATPEASVSSPKQFDLQDLDESSGKHRFVRNIGTKAKSVASVLRDRLSPDVMDGVPIITRSDGTVGDIGTDMFSRPLIDASRSTGSLNMDAAEERPRRRRVRAHSMPAFDTREEFIANNVSEVEVGLYPEHRSVEDLEAGDPWEEALAAMGASIGQPMDNRFDDVIGDLSTLDEPDDLETTGFISYRELSAQGRLSQGVKQVDGIYRNEQASKNALGDSGESRKFLRVIDGGTGSLRVRREIPVGEREERRPRGRHFARKDDPIAKEA